MNDTMSHHTSYIIIHVYFEAKDLQRTQTKTKDCETNYICLQVSSQGLSDNLLGQNQR